MTITANDPDILSLIKITDTKGNKVNWQYNAFPDGQVQIKIHKNDLHDGASFNVKASLPNPIVLDLFYQLMYNSLNYPINSVTVNYLYGARCDKRTSGDYRVANVGYQVLDAIYDIVSDCSFLAPHCVDYFRELGDEDFRPIYTIPDCVHLSDYDCVVFPDESAYKRYADQLNGKEYVICEKQRDQETGNIISHKIPNLPDGVKRILVLDDLADGCASFDSVAKAWSCDIKADLFIFHGVFSGDAIPRIFKSYQNVFVSNSLPHVQEKADVINAWKNHSINYKQACEQLNVKDFLKYKDFTPGNLIVFDVWNFNSVSN
jgi:phosphoribosylpyrophosphate synthetase